MSSKPIDDAIGRANEALAAITEHSRQRELLVHDLMEALEAVMDEPRGLHCEDQVRAAIAKARGGVAKPQHGIVHEQAPFAGRDQVVTHDLLLRVLGNLRDEFDEHRIPSASDVVERVYLRLASGEIR